MQVFFGEKNERGFGEEKTRGGHTPARQPNRSGSGDPHLQTFTEIRRARACPSPTLTRAGEKPCSWRSPDRHRIKNGHSCPTERQVRIWRSPPTDPIVDGDCRRQPDCRWRSPDRHSAGSGDPALQRDARGGTRPALLYFACFTSPNVVNARCAGETGPRNRRVTNVSGLPPNETSSI